MAIRIYDTLQKNFVGAGIADGSDLFNNLVRFEWSEDTRRLVIHGKDANGDDIETTIDLSAVGGSVSGGLSESDVRYTIGQTVSPWALEGNTDFLPTSKMTVGTTSAAGIVEFATNQETTTGTSTDKANTPASLAALLATKDASETAKGFVQRATAAEVTAATDTSKYMSVKQITDLVAAQRTGQGGLNTAAVDARIAQWARAANTDRIPVAKLPDATTTAKGVARFATDAEVDTGTNTSTLVTPAGLKRYVDANAGGSSGGISAEAGSILAFPSRPSNLKSYPLNTVFRTVSPPSWWIVDHDLTDDLSTLRYQGAVLASGNYGVGIVSGGSGFTANGIGSIRNVENVALTTDNSPVGLIVIEPKDGQNVPSTTEGKLKIYIKDSIVSAVDETELFVRTYASAPSQASTLGTTAIDRGESITLNGVLYRVYRGDDDLFGTNKLDPQGYIRFFTALPVANDQNTNRFDIFHEGKKLVEISKPYTPAIPEDDVDFAHDVSFVAFEEDSPAAHTYNFSYDNSLNNRIFEAYINIHGHENVGIRYYQVAHGDAVNRGRWTIDRAVGTTTGPFAGKIISDIEFKVGTNAAVEIPVRRDTGITNGYSLHSTSPLTSDPTGLTGQNFPNGVSIQLNFRFNDGTYAYSKQVSVKREKVSKESMVTFIRANQTQAASDTGAQIKAKLEGLEEGSRLNASFVDNVEANIKTPQRLGSLPFGDVNWGREIWHNGRGNNVPYYSVWLNPVEGTTLENTDIGGASAWWRKSNDYDHGMIYPEPDENFVAISSQRVFVKRGTLTDLTHIESNGTEFLLVRTAQAAGTKLITDPNFSGLNPDVDYYTISGTLGLTRRIRFKKSNDSWLPSSSNYTEGVHEATSRTWFPSSYWATAFDEDRAENVKIACAEITIGTNTYNLEFNADGPNFSIEDPFAGIQKLIYNNVSTDTDNYQKFTVRVYVDGFVDENTPTQLVMRGHTYALHYVSTDSLGWASYRTDVADAADRITSTNLAASIKLTKRNGGVYKTTNVQSLGLMRRTLDLNALRRLSSGIRSVHALPAHPHQGEEVRLLNRVPVSGYAVLNPGTKAVTGGGVFVGWDADTGTLSQTSPSIESFGAYFGGSGTLNNVVAARRKTGVTKTLTNIVVDGVRYSMSAMASPFTQYSRIGDTTLNRLAGVRAFFSVGHRRKVQFEFNDGTREFVDLTFQAGETRRYVDLEWRKEGEPIEEWAEVDNTDKIPRDKLPIVELTQAAYDALTTKDPNTYYLIT